MRYFLALTLPLYVLDQLTKWLVLRSIGTDDQIAVIPGFFYLVQVHNTGAAFGMLSNNNVFFIALASVAMVVIAVLWKRGAFPGWPAQVGVALLLSGVLGNLTDRLRLGFVVDFLHFILPWYGHWPAFNVADSCICVAAGLLLIGALTEPKKATAS